MNSKLQIIDTKIGTLLETLKRFPFAMISSYIFTIIVMTLATLSYQEKELLEGYNLLNKIALVASIGFFLFTTIRLISRNYLLVVLGFVLLISYYIYLPDDIRKFHELEMEYPIIILSLLSLMIGSPYLLHSTSNIKFWSWAKHILFSLLLSIIFGFILFLGISGAFSITEKLFELEKTRHYVEQVGLFTLGIFGTYFFLFQLPKYPRLLPTKEYSAIERIFTKFILTPLFALYFIILYTYTAKTVFLWEWPKGTVSVSILLFSALAILTYLFWTPLWSKKNEKYKNFFWFAIIFQTFVLGVALYLRVEPYGWTNNRYMVALFGFWLFIISLYFILNKKASYRVIFISLPILLIFSIFSPLSAYNIAKQSQQTKLKELLFMEDNLSEESNLSLRYNISSAISYLSDKHGIESLLPVIPEVVTSYQNLEENLSNNCSSKIYGDFSNYATRELGFKYVDRWVWEQHLQELNSGGKFKGIKMTEVFTRDGGEYSVDVKGYDWLLHFFYFSPQNSSSKYCSPPREKKRVSKDRYTIETQKSTIVIKEKRTLLATIDIEKFLHKIKNSTPKEDSSKNAPLYYSPPIALPVEELSYYFSNERVDVKLMFTVVEVSSMEKDKIIRYGGEILIKTKPISSLKNEEM